MNKLINGNLVRGLASKVFKNNLTCVACKKGKQHRASLTKPHNKTPYELLLGRTPSIGFIRTFGCPVTIINTLNPLGKFDGKADEGFLVRYSVNSKAFRVFNSKTRISQETLHINFLENQPNVAGSGPTWLFDIDTLTQSMNYQPVVARNQPNHNAGIQENLDAGKVRKGTESFQQYVLLSLWSTSSKDPQNTYADAAFDVKENESKVSVSPSSSDKPKKHDEKTKRKAKGKSPRVNAASAPVTTVGSNSTNNTNSFNDDSPSDNDNKGDGMFISQDKYVAEILRKFGLTDGKSASTPIDTEKPLLKDLDGKDVDVHIYRLMIGSLMYLTSSRPDIMIVIYACARFQVTLIVSHLHTVKRIFRYLKGKRHLGLWYPKDSPFSLVAYSDSDYARVSLDRKSTIGGCQFLGYRLIYWQYKKHTIVATSSTEAEYVVVASCCAQVL
nr:hypothetical protein [Tanacetum cinerariifolium]